MYFLLNQKFFRVSLAGSQTPLLNKLQTPSTTPPPQSLGANHHHGSAAHRKLFSNIDTHVK